MQNTYPIKPDSLQAALSSRFSISLIIACAVHALLLFSAHLSSDGSKTTPPPERPLRVTLATLPSVAPVADETIAIVNQQGRDERSQAIETLAENEANPVKAQPTQTPPQAAATPVLARNGGSNRTQATKPSPQFRQLPQQSQTQTETSARLDTPQTRAATADVRAAYLESWRQIVERTGNASLPQHLIEQSAGKRLTLEVTLDADGYLIASHVRTSSGSPTLDTAAQNILRNAAPFSRFPQALRQHYKQLSFAYDWRFLGN